MALVTFIIPTIGRSTLKDTIQCLFNQTNPAWEAIIIFDGIEPTISSQDPRLQIVRCEKSGEGHNGAGKVRNFGIALATTEWVAFVDDDDGIKSCYVNVLADEISQHPTDCILFRMLNWDTSVLPCNNTDTFYSCQVGISFAVKKAIFDSGLWFEPSSVEDFSFLEKMRANHYKMMISPYLLYFVRSYDTENRFEVFNRVFINS